MEINRERFEAWLFSQPDERMFDYMDVNGGCAVCAFIRETTQHKEACGGVTNVWLSRSNCLDEVNSYHIPNWLRSTKNGVLTAYIRTDQLFVHQMKRRYIELFGDPLAETVPQPSTTEALHDRHRT
jgi:hypothetical protein